MNDSIKDNFLNRAALNDKIREQEQEIQQLREQREELVDIVERLEAQLETWKELQHNTLDALTEEREDSIALQTKIRGALETLNQNENRAFEQGWASIWEKLRLALCSEMPPKEQTK